MADVTRTYEIKVAMNVQTGSGVFAQDVHVEGETVAGAFDSAMKGLASIIRPALVAQDEMMEAARRQRENREGK